MRTVRVERTIEAPAERAFELLTDHANYRQFRGVRSSELVREGEPDPNGAGAMRRIVIPPITFEEEITAFEPPARMDYVIRKVNVPLEHEGGTIEVEATPSGSRVVWVSTFRMTTPLIGGLLTGAAVLGVRRGFNRIIDDVERLSRSPDRASTLSASA